MAEPVMKRKIRVVRRPETDGGSPAEKAWRVAFARALRDEVGLAGDFLGLTMARMSLAEVLDLPPERALILMLEGPEEGLGFIALSPEIMVGIVEMLTLGRCAPLPSEPRRPSRTDAAMIAPVAEQALRNLEGALEDEPDLVWTDGFRFASGLEDARPLGLLLEDEPFRVLRARVSLADGAREGEVVLVLPAQGRGRKPGPRAASADEVTHEVPFPDKLAAQVELSPARLDAIIARLRMPIAEAAALKPDMVIALPDAGLDRISLEGLDGRRLVVGRLGQQRGMRAVRLTSEILRARQEPESFAAPSTEGAAQADWGSGQFAPAMVPPLQATGTG